MTTVVSLEGIPGAGKSTIIDQLRNRYPVIAGREVHYLTEPVGLWSGIRDNHGRTALEQYYADQARHAFAFQILALTTTTRQLREAIDAHPDAVIVTERSIWTGAHVFVESLCHAEKISSTERQVYDLTFNELLRTINPLCEHTVVHLDVPVATCLKRVLGRGRPGEDGLTAGYLAECDRYHKQFFDTTGLRKQNCAGEFGVADVAAAIDTLLAIKMP